MPSPFFKSIHYKKIQLENSFKKDNKKPKWVPQTKQAVIQYQRLDNLTTWIFL